MAQVGRKPKPTAVKRLQGTTRADRVSKREPQPERGIPQPSRYLNRTEKRFYRMLAKELDAMGVVTMADGMALEVASMAYGELREARDWVEENGQGYAYHDANGSRQRKRMPEVGTAQAARKELRQWLTEFGLTPASRTRVQVVKEIEEDDYESFAKSETIARKAASG